MYRANFRSVFIGIETPRIGSLQEPKKFQNTRGDSMEAKLARIQNAGLDINDLKCFLTQNALYRRDIIGFAQFLNRCVNHWHFYKFTREATAGRLRTYNSG